MLASFCVDKLLGPPAGTPLPWCFLQQSLPVLSKGGHLGSKLCCCAHMETDDSGTLRLLRAGLSDIRPTKHQSFCLRLYFTDVRLLAQALKRKLSSPELNKVGAPPLPAAPACAAPAVATGRLSVQPEDTCHAARGSGGGPGQKSYGGGGGGDSSPGSAKHGSGGRGTDELGQEPCGVGGEPPSGGASAAPCVAEVAERRTRLALGLKRYFHHKRMEGLLSNKARAHP